VSTPARCSDLSELAREPIGATATWAESWLLVEMRRSWARDVGGGEGLREPERAAARAWLDRTPASRLLFLRRPGRGESGEELAFVVRASETRAEVRRLAAAELTRLEEGDDVGDVMSQPLVLVCGHGTRDRCCALRGTAIYRALASTLDREQLWLSSHQGGHRFAANVLVLPSGIQLGRVPRDDARELVSRALDGRIDLPHFRGRTCYPAPVQAAEIAVRETHALDRGDDLVLVAAEDDRVRFRDSAGREHAAVVAPSIGPVVPASCGAEPEPQHGFTARVV
jgi:hypothetical protein